MMPADKDRSSSGGSSGDSGKNNHNHSPTNHSRSDSSQSSLSNRNTFSSLPPSPSPVLNGRRPLTPGKRDGEKEKKKKKKKDSNSNFLEHYEPYLIQEWRKGYFAYDSLKKTYKQMKKSMAIEGGGGVGGDDDDDDDDDWGDIAPTPGHLGDDSDTDGSSRRKQGGHGSGRSSRQSSAKSHRHTHSPDSGGNSSGGDDNTGTHSPLHTHHHSHSHHHRNDRCCCIHEFDESFLIEIQRVAHFMSEITHQINSDLTLLHDEMQPNVSSKYNKSFNKIQKNHNYELSLRQLYEKIHRLEEFYNLNYYCMVKIAKKFNKLLYVEYKEVHVYLLKDIAKGLNSGIGGGTGSGTGSASNSGKIMSGVEGGTGNGTGSGSSDGTVSRAVATLMSSDGESAQQTLTSSLKTAQTTGGSSKRVAFTHNTAVPPVPLTRKRTGTLCTRETCGAHHRLRANSVHYRETWKAFDSLLESHSQKSARGRGGNSGKNNSSSLREHSRSPSPSNRSRIRGSNSSPSHVTSNTNSSDSNKSDISVLDRERHRVSSRSEQLQHEDFLQHLRRNPIDVLNDAVISPLHHRIDQGIHMLPHPSLSLPLPLSLPTNPYTHYLHSLHSNQHQHTHTDTGTLDGGTSGTGTPVYHINPDHLWKDTASGLYFYRNFIRRLHRVEELKRRCISIYSSRFRKNYSELAEFELRYVKNKEHYTSETKFFLGVKFGLIACMVSEYHPYVCVIQYCYTNTLSHIDCMANH